MTQIKLSLPFFPDELLRLLSYKHVGLRTLQTVPNTFNILFIALMSQTHFVL